jgi:purine-binding chemotaxis protein CheW
MAFPARSPPSTTAAPAADSELAVVVRARARHCAFIATGVAEVMRPLPIEVLANMPGFVLGLAIIRGAPTPVVDAGALLGEHGEGQPTRFVVMRVQERRVALAVEAVLGVKRLAGETLQALPPLLRHAADDVVAAIGTLDAQLLTVLGGGYLLPPAVWEQLATTKARP